MLIRRRNLTVGGPAETARQFGISIKALKLYERFGLVNPRRTWNGWRTYTDEDINRLSHALMFKAMGFGLSQIGTLLDSAPEHVAAALAAQEERLRAQRAAVDDALIALRRARRQWGAPTLRLVA